METVWEWRETRTAARSQLKEQDGGRLENAEERVSRVRGNKECMRACPLTLQSASESKAFYSSFSKLLETIV